MNDEMNFQNVINQRDHVLWYKLNGLMRYCLAHFASNVFPLYIVNEYPKSGGSWIGSMLSDVLKIPLPRNRLPILGPSILHGHMMQSWNMNNVLCIWRDGRDILVSQYYHWLFKNDRGNASLVAKCRADLGFSDYDDIASNLIPFMEYVFEHPSHPRFTWNEFVMKWADCKKCTHVRYEDMRMQPVEELKRVVFEISGKKLISSEAENVVEKYSFERVSGRKVGEVNKQSFLRKGVVGDWKNHFSFEARRRFHDYAGDALIKLGYVRDSCWVDEGVP